MNLSVEIDFTTPDVIRQAEGQELWRNATRFNKTPGRRDTYSITLQYNGDTRIEELVGDAMGYIRNALPEFDPYRVLAVGVHVTEIGAPNA